MTEVFLKGPTGRLEGQYHQSVKHDAPVVLVLHPEPQEGGTMNNRVVYDVYKSFVKNGFSVLRINFRGVGKSQGVFSKDEGELSDATAALDWLHSRNMGSRSFWIAGFSFGAWVALQLVMRRPELEDYVLIAPPVRKKDFNFIVPSLASGLIVHGDNDEVACEDIIHDMVDKLISKSESKVDYYTIEGADHFFRDYHNELNEIVDNHIQKRILENMGKHRKIKRDRRRRRKKKREETVDDRPIYIDPIKPLDFD